MKEFDFYLDAYAFCNMHKIDPTTITKLTFRKWGVTYDSSKNSVFQQAASAE